jgi:two-component SAPR family response regulator
MRPTSGPLRGRRILLVEDEYFIADDMAEEFKRSGAEIVGPAATVRQTIQHIRGATKLDGAVLEINLQGEMVFPVADLLEEQGVPFVFSTGYDHPSIPARYARATRCEKPVEPSKVAQALFAIDRR